MCGLKFVLSEQFNFFELGAWPDWKQRFARYRVALLLEEEDEIVQVNALIYSLRALAKHIFKSFMFDSARDSNKYSVVMAKFNKHLITKHNVIYERAKFLS